MSTNTIFSLTILTLIVIIFLCTQRFLHTTKRVIIMSILISIFFEILISLLRIHISLQSATVVGFASYTITTYFLTHNKQKKPSNKIIIISITAAPLALLSIPRIFDFNGALISLPDQCFHLLGILTGYSLCKIKTYLRWTILLTSTLACIFTYTKGYDLWLNNLAYGTYTGNVNKEVIQSNIIFKDTKNKNININKLKGKIIVLDFWNTRCGVCLREFPQIQATYNLYKKNKYISFYTVNYFLKNIDQEGDAELTVKKYGFNFPIIICKNIEQLNVLKIKYYPTVIIINKKGQIVFRGSFNSAKNKIEELLRQPD